MRRGSFCWLIVKPLIVKISFLNIRGSFCWLIVKPLIVKIYILNIRGSFCWLIVKPLKVNLYSEHKRHLGWLMVAPRPQIQIWIHRDEPGGSNSIFIRENNKNAKAGKGKGNTFAKMGFVLSEKGREIFIGSSDIKSDYAVDNTFYSYPCRVWVCLCLCLCMGVFEKDID